MAKKHFSNFFRFIIIVAAILLVGAHVFVRTDKGAAKVLACLSDKSGLEIKAGKVRLTLGLALVLRDARVLSKDGSVALLEASQLVVSRRYLGWRAEAAGATLSAVRTPDGKWTPSALSALGDGPIDVFSFGKVSSAFGRLYFSVEDSTLTVISGESASTFSGFSWSRHPIRLEGHLGAVQNRISYSGGPVCGDSDAGRQSSLTGDNGQRATDEWFELDDSEEIVRLWGENRSNGPRIVGVISVASLSESETPAAKPEDAAAPEPDAGQTPVEQPENVAEPVGAPEQEPTAELDAETMPETPAATEVPAAPEVSGDLKESVAPEETSEPEAVQTVEAEAEVAEPEPETDAQEAPQPED